MHSDFLLSFQFGAELLDELQEGSFLPSLPLQDAAGEDLQQQIISLHLGSTPNPRRMRITGPAMIHGQRFPTSCWQRLTVHNFRMYTLSKSGKCSVTTVRSQ